MNEFMFAGKMCLTDCGVENCAVRFVILLMKNVLFYGGVQLLQSEKKSPFVFNEEKSQDDIKLLNNDSIVIFV